MNSIPLIFNERQINRAVLGGKEQNPFAKLKLAVILLNKKGCQFRVPVLESLVQTGFEQIISIENNPENYIIEDLVHKYPFVKFIIPLEKVTDGELINIGMSEVSADYVLVIRDTLKIEPNFLSQRILEKVNEMNIFCVVPRLICTSIPSFNIISAPSVQGSVFKVEKSSAVNEGTSTLFCVDSIGIYNRRKFIQLGGFDYTITNPHWQNADLFFRSWLWGEKSQVTTLLHFTYTDEIPVEDISADLSYSRFYLKNLLPHFDEDHGVIPKSSVFVYLFRSGCGLMESIRQFKDARRWVEVNKFRFKIDAKYLVENWGKL